MKKIIYNIIPILFIILLTAGLYLIFSVSPDTAVTQIKNNTVHSIEKVGDVINSKKSQEKFDEIDLFTYSNSSNKNSKILKTLKKYSALNLNRHNLLNLYNSKNNNITLNLPIGEKNNIKINLTRYELLSDDFLFTSLTGSGENQVKFDKGIHYRGIVEGYSNSLVSISVFENMIAGIVSYKNDTYNLNPYDEKDFNSAYIFYNDKDLTAKNNFKCGIEGKDLKFYKAPSNSSVPGKNDKIITNGRQPVRIYIEADYRLYLDKGSNIQSVGSFITTYYNAVASIYQNEYLPIVISQISVWNTPDPYSNISSSDQYLYAFGQNKKDNFNGDLAQLLSTRPLNLGGIAWVNTLCENYNPQDYSGRFSFCNIENSYSPYPVYSWTVMVSTHELGHNFGSMHTHACWWPVRNGSLHDPIDSCYYAEQGTCFDGTYPTTGTIMSYCHLQENYGGSIDPTLGFGPLPGDTIRLRYNQCAKFGPVLNSSELPVVFDMMQNYPNPFNPVTVISIAIPELSSVSIKVYDINGREVANIIENDIKSAGYHNIRFNASNYSLASGIYFYRMSANGINTNNKFIETKRMLLIK